MSVRRAGEMPIRTALSGPAAGVVGAVAAGARFGHRDLITFDMGGTSTDVCLVRDGKAEMAFGRSVAGFPVRLTSIDIHTVGAGGGSVAHIGRDGLMRVGPMSTGADPGPACYGKGGREATVSWGGRRGKLSANSCGRRSFWPARSSAMSRLASTGLLAGWPAAPSAIA